jgi:hypothetical protein
MLRAGVFRLSVSDTLLGEVHRVLTGDAALLRLGRYSGAQIMRVVDHDSTIVFRGKMSLAE